MKIYIATPINARREGTWAEKFAAAQERVAMLKQMYADGMEFGGRVIHPEFCSTFDINGIDTDEADAIAACVWLVLQCDAIYLDRGWKQSNGCNLEYRTAKIYGKDIIEHEWI